MRVSLNFFVLSIEMPQISQDLFAVPRHPVWCPNIMGMHKGTILKVTSINTLFLNTLMAFSADLSLGFHSFWDYSVLIKSTDAKV